MKITNIIGGAMIAAMFASAPAPSMAGMAPNTCDALGSMARLFIIAKKLGTPYSEQLKNVREATTGRPPEMRKMFVSILELAYKWEGSPTSFEGLIYSVCINS